MQSVSTLCSNQEGRDFSFKCQCHKHVQSGKYFLSKQPCVTFTELVMKELQLQLEHFSLPRSLQMLQCGGEAPQSSPAIACTLDPCLPPSQTVRPHPGRGAKTEIQERKTASSLQKVLHGNHSHTANPNTQPENKRGNLSRHPPKLCSFSKSFQNTEETNHQLVIKISGCYTLHCQRIPIKLHFGTIL